jgi:hypothetical protein
VGGIEIWVIGIEAGIKHNVVELLSLVGREGNASVGVLGLIYHRDTVNCASI